MRWETIQVGASVVLEHLLRHVPGKVLVTWDRVSNHRSRRPIQTGENDHIGEDASRWANIEEAGIRRAPRDGSAFGSAGDGVGWVCGLPITHGATCYFRPLRS